MAKQLLVGPAGSGKTGRILDEFEACLKEAADPLAEDFFLILPSMEHTGRMVSRIVQRGIPGFFHQRITTLPHLIQRVFHIGEEDVASNVSRYLVLREVLTQQNWPCFEEIHQSPGFLNVMLGFIAELKESLLSVDEFRARMNALKQVEPDFSHKYEALAGLYEGYQEGLSARGLRDRQDRLIQALAQKDAWPPRAGSVKLRKVWFDGFFDFSDWQMAHMRALCESADDLCVTLTLDDNPARADLFETVRKARQLFESLDFEVEVLGRPVRRAATPTLAFLEENLFAASAVKEKAKPSREVSVFEAIGIEGEVEMIARTVRHMADGGDTRFSDFAILLRNIGDYDKVIRAVFGRYDIPVEIHERERMRFAPLTQAVTLLLKVFTDGWKTQDLLSLLKSSYLRKLGGGANDPEWVGRLEHESQRRAVFGGREAWLEDWKPGKHAGRDFDQQKRLRLGALAAIEDELRAARSFRELKGLMRRIAERDLGMVQTGEAVSGFVRRDAASDQRFQALLDELEASYPASGMEAEKIFPNFSERFLRLVDLDLYSLHQRDKNCVQVYNVSLARQKDYRVVFLAGLLEKGFPVQIREDPVLSDWERTLFNADRSEGILKLRAPSQATERYLFYLAVTRAREKLILTYPHLNLEGKQALPSAYVEDVGALFRSELPVYRQQLGKPYPAVDMAVTARELELGVLGELGHGKGEQDRALAAALLPALLEDEAARERFRKTLFEEKAVLKDASAQALAAFRPFETSPTALEEYGKCAFKYFAHRVLRLEDPEEDTHVFRRGTILHEVLENLFLAARGKPVLIQDFAQARGFIHAELPKVLERHPLFLDKAFRYDLEISALTEMLEKFVEEEIERLRLSPLKPRHFELAFGGEEADTPPLSIADGDKVIEVRGKIDRVDLDEEGKQALVLDYKRTARFNRPDLALGTALQLPLYAMVAEEHLKLQAVGAELYSLKEREKSGFYRESGMELFPGLSRRRMILGPEAWEALIEQTKTFVRKFSKGMQEACIEVRPRECSRYGPCPYAPVCRIEKWRLPLILDEIRAEDAAGASPEAVPASEEAR